MEAREPQGVCERLRRGQQHASTEKLHSVQGCLCASVLDGGYNWTCFESKEYGTHDRVSVQQLRIIPYPHFFFVSHSDAGYGVPAVVNVVSQGPKVNEHLEPGSRIVLVSS